MNPVISEFAQLISTPTPPILIGSLRVIIIIACFIVSASYLITFKRQMHFGRWLKIAAYVVVVLSLLCALIYTAQSGKSAPAYLVGANVGTFMILFSDAVMLGRRRRITREWRERKAKTPA